MPPPKWLSKAPIRLHTRNQSYGNSQPAYTFRKGSKPMKILMIEDDKLTTEVIRLTLEVHDPNSTIFFSEKGRDGLESARKGPFDVVLLDLGLPDIDGMKVLEELKEFCTIPIIIVSARHDSTVIANALSLGAADYILKPF